MSNIIHETVKGIEAVALNDEYLRQGKVFLTGPVTTEQCNEISKQILFLAGNPEIEEITLFISSPGGEIVSGLSLYDYIRLASAVKPLKTVCLGMCASMGAILFLAGDTRCMTPHGEIMIHDPSYGNGHSDSYKKPHEIQSELDSLNKKRELLGKLIAERTGMPIEKVYEYTAEDSYFSAEEAIKNNLATTLITDLRAL